jgi:hypothetical protein
MATVARLLAHRRASAYDLAAVFSAASDRPSERLAG